MKEMEKHGNLTHASERAGMDRKTARKYVRTGILPSEQICERSWRTRKDPFSAHWEEVEAQLRATPTLEAKTVMSWLMERYPSSYAWGHLRTLQRRMRQWRSQHGPSKEVFFPQVHRPGEAGQTDFTEATSLGVTICGEPFRHLLCVFVLPYSAFVWATVCMSESIAALRKGIDASLRELGGVPAWHQTDNSTAATHRIPKGKGAPTCHGKRPFNEDYLAVMRHFGMQARTTAVGQSEQNGSVEAHNGALKRALEQALLLRGSRDFSSVSAWQDFVHAQLKERNLGRSEKLTEELGRLSALPALALKLYDEEEVRVSKWSTVRLRHCSYSVPARLIGEKLKARVFEERIELWFAGRCELSCPRLLGRFKHSIDYRHVIWSLVRKPGAFARYRYREEMFPSLVFRKTYDALTQDEPGARADRAYLRILHLAASTFECDVEQGCAQLLSEGRVPGVDALKALLHTERPQVPQLETGQVDLHAYDALLSEVAS